MNGPPEVHDRAIELSELPHATLALLACGVEIERDQLLAALRDVVADLERVQSGLRVAIANETVTELRRRLEDKLNGRIRLTPSDVERALKRVDARIDLATAALRKYQQ